MLRLNFDTLSRALVGANNEITRGFAAFNSAIKTGNFNKVQEVQNNITKANLKFQFLQALYSMLVENVKRIIESIRSLGR